jgi:hypothetical protein
MNAVCYTALVRYYIQFTAGIGDLVYQTLTGELSGMRVEYSDDSAMIFEAADPPQRIAVLPYVKNAFLIVVSVGRGGLDASIVQLGRRLQNAMFPRSPDRGNGFRLMFHVDGALVPVNPKDKAALERAVAARTGRHVEPRGSCQEYWVVGRTGLDKLLLCMRLPRPRREEKARGAISRELSAVMVAASGPDPRDVFLDPFGGSGPLLSQGWSIPSGKSGTPTSVLPSTVPPSTPGSSAMTASGSSTRTRSGCPASLTDRWT